MKIIIPQNIIKIKLHTHTHQSTGEATENHKHMSVIAVSLVGEDSSSLHSIPCQSHFFNLSWCVSSSHYFWLFNQCTTLHSIGYWELSLSPQCLDYEESGKLLYLPLQQNEQCVCACAVSSLPGSSGHRISQARILDWVDISFSKGSSWPKDWTCISCVSCIGRQILYH